MRTMMLMMAGMLAAPAAANEPLTFDRLTCMSWCELEQLYRQLRPGTMPNGFARGKTIYCPDERLAGLRSRLTDRVWQGKHFCAANGTLVNQWKHVQAIRACVDYGPSWLDGKPALVLDYHGMSHVWSDVRDEMREVCPGVYLGAMYLRRCPEAKLKVFFVLEMQCHP